MNRRQKIIVSVTGIFLVLLLLVGLTYAYFLTRINGNTNTKSISVSTANLALVYGDGNGIITGDKIQPGTTLDTKTFTVTNTGNEKTDYVVVIEDVSVTYAETIEVDGVTQTAGSTTTFQSNDFVYTLTCTSGCNGVDKETTFPINGGILVGNSIDVGEEQTYAFTLTYKETGLDQTDDMNKTLNAKLNIKDISTINPYNDNTSSLAYNIINNAITGATGTTLASVPLAPVATSISDYDTGKYSYETVSTGSLCSGTDPWLVGDTATAAQSGSTVSSYDAAVGKYVYDQCSGWTKYLDSYDSTASTLTFRTKEIAHEKTLSVAQDDLGTSYYYRGAVEDNYVTFAGMCWRIVRIAGDGSVKLVLEDQDEVCSTSMNGNWGIPTTTGGTTYTGNYGYESKNVDSDSYNESIMSYLKPVTNADKSMVRAFYDFQKDKLEDYKSKLKSGNWCLADKAYTQSGSSPNYTYTLLEEYNYSSNMYYDSYVRLVGKSTKEPTLKCTGRIIDNFESVTYNGTEIVEEAPMYVGAITADEIAYAGGKYGTTNQNYYLINEEFKKGGNGANKAYSFWSLSPYGFSGDYDNAFGVNYSGSLNDNYVASAARSVLQFL